MSFWKKNFIYIGEKLIQTLVKRQEITLLDSRKNQRYKDVQEKENRYYKINESKNRVLFIVQNGYGVIINETVDNDNVVDILKDYYWYIDNTNNIVKCSTLKSRYLARCIGSIIKYKDITKKLPTKEEVHHVQYHWDNITRDICIVDSQVHKAYHDGIGTRKSHCDG